MSSDLIYSGLVSRGFSPVQAAALAGNIQQESAFNPAAVNPGEQAFGLLQWRLDRRQSLENLARERGLPATDIGTQLDFIRQEMAGPEARNATGFLNAQDLPGANAALRKFIRYGDNSEPARLNFAKTFMGEQQPIQPTAPTTFGSLGPMQTPQAPQAQQAPQAANPMMFGSISPQVDDPPIPPPWRPDISRIAALMARPQRRAFS